MGATNCKALKGLVVLNVSLVLVVTFNCLTLHYACSSIGRVRADVWPWSPNAR